MRKVFDGVHLNGWRPMRNRRKKYTVYEPGYVAGGVYIRCSSRIRAKKAAKKLGAGSSIWVNEFVRFKDGSISFWNVVDELVFCQVDGE